MFAIVAESADRLTWQPAPDVAPAPGEVLIKVAAAGVNRADLLQAAGKYPPPPGASDIIGLEVSGTIEAVGDHVAHWSPGQQVCALLAGGGYAEYVAVPAGQVMPVPGGLELAHAAQPEAKAPKGQQVVHAAQAEAKAPEGQQVGRAVLQGGA